MSGRWTILGQTGQRPRGRVTRRHAPCVSNRRVSSQPFQKPFDPARSSVFGVKGHDAIDALIEPFGARQEVNQDFSTIDLALANFLRDCNRRQTRFVGERASIATGRAPKGVRPGVRAGQFRAPCKPPEEYPQPLHPDLNDDAYPRRDFAGFRWLR